MAAMQSPIGQQLMESHGLHAEYLDSLVLIQKGKVYTHSLAALKLCTELRGAWKLLYAFRIFPAFLRNWVYNWVAANRYRWFGRQESCMLPSKHNQGWFL
jgi:predicted DCC family thiol-disulfide oxidoreductase YuxK